jgi:hypothetical protein
MNKADTGIGPSDYCVNLARFPKARLGGQRYCVMWAVTSYFNPVGYKNRLPNYRVFRARLGIPLVAVELSFDGNFELTEKDADVLIQISGGAVLWQKERLLNIALKAVPSDVDNVAWIDCDVVFERSDWVDEANNRLNEFNVVQLLSDQVDLRPDDHRVNFDYRDVPASGHGVISMSAAAGSFGGVPAPGPNRRSFAWGLAWAAKRRILQDHGLYDAMIVGGGPRALAIAIYGDFEIIADAYQLAPAHREHYLNWARPYHRAVGGRVGHVPGRLYHLWHGDIGNRNYAGRYRGLVDFDFQPDDIVIGSNGAWQWARSKPGLQKFLMDHFINRAEDG